MSEDHTGAATSGSVAAPVVTPSTSVPPDAAPATARIAGVDVTRGIALLGMMAVHVFDGFHSDGSPTAVMAVAGGRAAATFALVAGISLAFMTGRRRAVQGTARAAATASIVVRALLIGGIGLWLGYLGSDAAIILPYYAVIFLLAVPLLGLRPRALGTLSLLLAVVVPLFLLVTDLPDYSAPDNNVTFGALLYHPVDRAIQLLFTGDYPAVAWMVYICAGLAFGRLDLSSARVAACLLFGGLGLAIASWHASSLLLFDLGGMDQLRDAAPGGAGAAEARNAILWNPHYTSSWWWLALRAPYAVTPMTLLSTLGVATALLGAVLLVTRSAVGARMSSTVAAAGSMTLTLYSAHLVVLATGFLGNYPLPLFILLVAGALGFATVWRSSRGQGPLEAMVAVPAGWARQAVTWLARAGDPAPRPASGDR